MTTESPRTRGRAAVYTIGPRFFLSDDGRHTLFAYRVDSACEIGPREATDADKARYPEAWEAFEAGHAEPVTEPPKRRWKSKEEPAELVAEASRRAKIGE